VTSLDKCKRPGCSHSRGVHHQYVAFAKPPDGDHRIHDVPVLIAGACMCGDSQPCECVRFLEEW
jgi:hypothetical protein